MNENCKEIYIHLSRPLVCQSMRSKKSKKKKIENYIMCMIKFAVSDD